MAKLVRLKKPTKFRLPNVYSDKYLLALWKQVGMKKANGFCEYPFCRKSEYLNAHHFFSRSRMSVRYDPDNCIILCPSHHSLGNDSAHKSPNFKDTIIEHGVRSKDWLRIMTLRANTPSKIDRKLVFLDLTNELKKHERTN
jgi:5-methylcytosine-specific restriction endonuclease McrA